MNISWQANRGSDLLIAHGWPVVADREPRESGRMGLGIIRPNATFTGDDAGQANFSRPQPRSPGRRAACQTGLRAAGAEIHADPPSGTAGAAVQPPAARRL